MPPLKAAVIGLGHIAEDVHIPYLQQSALAEVVALCSRSLPKAQEAASRLGVPQAFASVDEMLQMARPDVVVVCTPNAFHFEAVMKALDAGCHVFCEKPPGISLAEAEAMEKKAVKKKLLLAYNLTLRQKQEALEIKKRVDEGFFGQVYHINASFVRRRGIPGWGNFTNKEIQGGGALIDIGVHILDLALYFLNYPQPKGVLANTYDFIGKQGGVGFLGQWDPQQFSVEDSCFAYIKLENNVSISLQAAFALNTKQRETVNIELFGSKAGARLNPLEFYTGDDHQLLDNTIHYPQTHNVQKQSVETFLQACHGQPTNICTASQGTRLQQLLEMIYADAGS